MHNFVSEVGKVEKEVGMWERLVSFFFGKQVSKYETAVDTANIPIRTGATAQTSDSYIEGYDIASNYDLRWFDVLEDLAHKKEYISYAVDNLMMANTESQTYFADNISTRNQKLMKEHLSKSTYFDGGVEMLKKVLYRQLAIKGVLCGEAFIDENKKVRFNIINPAEIRIRKVNGKYKYFQYPTNLREGYEIEMKAGFVYIPLVRSDSNPYPIIPFLPALEHLDTQVDMVDSVKKGAKKYGLLGFLSAKIKEPTQKQGESPQSFTARAEEYLDKSANQIKNNLKDGFTVGYMDKHDFNMVATNSNVAGANDLVKMINHLVFAGLKQDANLLGENYATTETFGNVILAKYAKQLEEFQKNVAKVLEYIYLLDLVVGGFNPIYVKVEFEKVMIADREKEEDIRKKKIDNCLSLYNAGILSLQQVANELGYDSPFLPTPLLSPTQTNVASTQNNFDYAIPQGCNSDFDFKDKKMNEFAQNYLAESEKLYRSSVRKAMKNVKVKAGEQFTNAKAFADSILTVLNENWYNDFKKPMEKVVNKHISKIYTYFRTDKQAIISNSFDDKIPDSVFNQLDKRLQEYLKNVDNLYLGKFLTDPDTTKRFIDFLTKYYADNDGQIGEGEAIDAFVNEFQSKVNNEAWKIARIVATTLNRTRNYATVLYMQQAEIEQYEILEVGDRLTCAYCNHLDGMTFSVGDTVTKITKEIEGGAENLPSLSPFVTTQSIEEFKKLTNAEVKGLGFLSPPFHANCRGMVVRI